MRPDQTTILIKMKATQSHDSIFDSDSIYLENKSISLAWAFKMYNFKMKNLRNVVKSIRKKLNLNKSPKSKGYGQFFTDEEKR